MSDGNNDDGGARPGPAARGGDAAARLRAAWSTLKPGRRDLGKVLTEFNASKMVVEGSVFERGLYVPFTHMKYFKPPADAFLSDFRARDRRSAKEWEYVNAAGVWAEM